MTQSARTTSSRADFLREGFLIWPGFLDHDRRRVLLEESVKLLAEDTALHTPESVRVTELFRRGQVFVDLMCDEGLLATVDELLGPGALLSDLSLNQVSSGGKPDRWHFDYPYNDMRETARGSLLGLQCVLPLTRFDATTGATEFIPGSHQRYAPPPGSPADTPESFVAEPGDLLILSSSTWHKAGSNSTQEPRIALLLSFVEAWVRPMFGPPEPGPWSVSRAARLRLGMERMS